MSPAEITELMAHCMREETRTLPHLHKERLYLAQTREEERAGVGGRRVFYTALQRSAMLNAINNQRSRTYSRSNHRK